MVTHSSTKISDVKNHRGEKVAVDTVQKHEDDSETRTRQKWEPNPFNFLGDDYGRGEVIEQTESDPEGNETTTWPDDE